ncbi:hypothetical protein O6H91_05G049500 [Diphasiastrum complanatum]|uniref:Uncharacterized protein n=1 Tax=Diphasiastrum complanatum TaxID=34168 RepID=A0ACC2DNA0_DIPCM|nr:hypothetical protein O6H91_05G049500 [Diphasiastrum complanatum]
MASRRRFKQKIATAHKIFKSIQRNMRSAKAYEATEKKDDHRDRERETRKSRLLCYVLSIHDARRRTPAETPSELTLSVALFMQQRGHQAGRQARQSVCTVPGPAPALSLPRKGTTSPARPPSRPRRPGARDRDAGGTGSRLLPRPPLSRAAVAQLYGPSRGQYIRDCRRSVTAKLARTGGRFYCS